MEQQHIMVWGIIINDPAKNREAVNSVLDQFKEQLTLQSDIPFPAENVTALALTFTGTDTQLYRIVETLDGLNVSTHDYCRFADL